MRTGFINNTYFIRWAMHENKVLEAVDRLKVITIDQLVNLLHCAVITVRRRLKKWNAYTSINQNGRYYTLPHIAVFDDHGLWRHQSILFSKHGNLKQTVLTLIRQSPMGLSAAEIAQLIDLSPNSSFFTLIHKTAGISREKHQGRFVYFSDSHEHYQEQKHKRIVSRPGASDWPSDAQAVVILVELIKHPSLDFKGLAARIVRQGYSIQVPVLEAFLRSHDLLKKTSDFAL